MLFLLTISEGGSASLYFFGSSWLSPHLHIVIHFSGCSRLTSAHCSWFCRRHQCPLIKSMDIFQVSVCCLDSIWLTLGATLSLSCFLKTFKIFKYIYIQYRYQMDNLVIHQLYVLLSAHLVIAICHHTKMLQYYELYALCCTSIPVTISS